MSGEPVLVAVVDSGWERARVEPRVLRGVGFDADGGTVSEDVDVLGHGTACTLEVLRWAPGARVVPVRVLGPDGSATPAALAAGICWAADQGAAVICLSLGSRRARDREPLGDACAYAAARGAILVAAGPNAGPPTYPAALPGVVCVLPNAALRPGELARTGLLRLEGSPDPRGCASGPGGTSLAAAEVAGRLADLLARHGTAEPEWLIGILGSASASGARKSGSGRWLLDSRPRGNDGEE